MLLVEYTCYVFIVFIFIYFVFPLLLLVTFLLLLNLPFNKEPDKVYVLNL